jgi:hypothetical protein
MGCVTSAIDDGDFTTESARYWIERLPVEIKAKWPGTFPEFPYDGEPEEERCQRAEWKAERQEGADR